MTRTDAYLDGLDDAKAGRERKPGSQFWNAPLWVSYLAGYKAGETRSTQESNHVRR